MAKGVVIAGASSGVGKTTLTLGLIGALKKRGVKVQPYKVGPDYIDAAHHTMISDYSCRNLDGWLLDQQTNTGIFNKHSSNRDISVVEGVMGLFDSSGGDSEEGSTAQMAKWLGLPVILVIDGGKMARSAGAIIHGFEHYDPELNLVGVIFNNVASENHFNHLKNGIRKDSRVNVLGFLPRNAEIKIPERHLGLTMPQEIDSAWREKLVSLVEAHVNIETILDIAKTAQHLPHRLLDKEGRKRRSVRIGIAKDEAFCFYYPDNLELLEEVGAELIYFSPLRDRALPENIHGIYLGGGYPELYTEELEANQNLRNEIKKAAEDGMPIYGECGGFMYLTHGIWKNETHFSEMANVFPIVMKMNARLSSLGYFEGELLEDTPFHKKGNRFRGHEFHYSSIIQEGSNLRKVYQISKRESTRQEGYLYRNVLGSYIHLHFAGNRPFVERFAERCRAWPSAS